MKRVALRSFSTIVVFVIASIGISPHALAAQEADDPLICATEVWPPFRINSPTQTAGFTGIDIELIRILEDALDRPIVIERHPFARALEMMRTGDADFITSIAYTEERDEYIAYVPFSYMAVQPVFYTQRGRGDEIQRYEDLYDYSIGYSLNSAYFEPFNSDGGLDKVGISTEEQLLRMVAIGRLDVTIGTEPNIGYDAVRLGLDDRVEPTAYVPEPNTPLYFGVSPQSPLADRIDEIERVLREIVDDGRMREITERYR